MRGKIIGTGSSVPENVVTNEQLESFLATSDEWIRERTGIARRHIKQKETTVSMAVEAARRAIDMAGISPEAIDLILVSTVSSNAMIPSTSCEVQKAVGATRAVCIDLNAACSGFLFSWSTAQAYFHTGLAQTALLVGAESLSTLVNWKDRSTAILFGDGAGAVLCEAREGEPFPVVMHSDGAKGGVLTCENAFWADPSKTERPYVEMNGQEVFKFAVRKVPEAIEELLVKSGKSQADIDGFVLHQANRRIIEGIAKKLGVDVERFPMNLEEYGNTSSASIPILLDELNRRGELKPGMELVLAGFGAGLSWGAALLEW